MVQFELSSLANLHYGDDEHEFFVWVSPTDWLVQHNLGTVGAFWGGPLTKGGDRPENLQFIANPAAKGEAISPFHLGVMRNYAIEYELERHRAAEFKEYPSRFFAVFLLQTREIALAYSEAHPGHTNGRVLKRAVSVGAYKYSVHDSSWIDFLREAHSADHHTIEICARGYWSGGSTDSIELVSRGEAWSGTSIAEVLFYGQISFPNRNLQAD